MIQLLAKYKVILKYESDENNNDISSIQIDSYSEKIKKILAQEFSKADISVSYVDEDDHVVATIHK